MKYLARLSQIIVSSAILTAIFPLGTLLLSVQAETSFPSCTTNNSLESISETASIKKLEELIKEKQFKKAIPLSEGLIFASKANIDQFPSCFSHLLRYRAFLHQTQGEYEQAEKIYYEAMKILGIQFSRIDDLILPNKYDREILAVLMNLGYLLYDKESYENAAYVTSLARNFQDKSEAPTIDGKRIGDPRFDTAIDLLISMIILKKNIPELVHKYSRFSGEKLFNNRLELVLQASFLRSSFREDSFFLDSFNSTGIPPNVVGILNDLSQHANLSIIASLQLGSNSSKDAIDVRRLAFVQQLIFKARSLDTVSLGLKDCLKNTKCQQLFKEWSVINAKISQWSYKIQTDISSVIIYEELNKRSKEVENEIRFFPIKRSSETGREFLRHQIDFQDIQSQLSTGTALIEISMYRPLKGKVKSLGDHWEDERYAAAILSSTGDPQWVDLGKVTEVDRSIEKFRIALAEQREMPQIARKLDQQVMAKIRPLLGNAKHLLISPDSQLNLIPFEALQDEDGRYLIDRYQFSYLTSGRNLLQIAESRKNPSESRQGTLILADPNYGLRNPQVSIYSSNGSVDSIESFGNASGTSELAKTLKAQIFPMATVLSREKATKTALKQLSSPKILILGTHGFFLTNPEKVVARSYDPLGSEQSQKVSISNPLLRSGLVLTGVNERNNPDFPLDGDNGVLTALEISGLDLRGTQLVVLSACETDVGKPTVGDGVYGLRRSLAIAGAESQVLSLWKVDGTATKDLMVNYFKKLSPKTGQGMGRHEALQESKKQLMKSPKYQHPYYWAGFIPSGDWTPLR
jgi:CHAT domain-containing protein